MFISLIAIHKANKGNKKNDKIFYYIFYKLFFRLYFFRSSSEMMTNKLNFGSLAAE
jgi:hypothetical protein